MKFSLAILLLALTANAQIIPTNRMGNWHRNNTLGVRGGIPSYTNIISAVATYGYTTNNNSTTGTIATGTNILTVADASGFSVGHGILISNTYYYPDSLAGIITNISGNTFYLNANIYQGATNSPVMHDNSPNLNAFISQRTNFTVLHITNGYYPHRRGFNIWGNRYAVRGNGITNTFIALLSASAASMHATAFSTQELSAGPLDGSGGANQAEQYGVLSGATRGSTNITLQTNYFAPYATTIATNHMFHLSQRNVSTTNSPTFNVYGGDRVESFIITVDSVSGNNITFSPPLPQDFTNQPYLIERFNAIGYNLGIEDLTIRPYLGSETNAPSSLIAIEGVKDSWLKNCSFAGANNYNVFFNVINYFTMSSCDVGPLYTIGTSHSGVLLQSVCSSLFENNKIHDSSFALQLWAGSCMQNAFFANYFTNIASVTFFAHAPGHAWNLFEHNFYDFNTNGPNGGGFNNDGYFGSELKNSVSLRNRSVATESNKRFSSGMVNVGGYYYNTNYNFVLSSLNPSNNNWFQGGSPFIGNAEYYGFTPPKALFVPDPDFYNSQENPGVQYSNLTYTFTSNLVSITNIPGNFTGWVVNPNGHNVLLFHDAQSNYYSWNTTYTTNPTAQISGALYALSVSATNMVVNMPITISNGWTMRIGCPDSFRSLDTNVLGSWTISGNFVNTNNQPGAIQWDSRGALDIPVSFVYSNSTPVYWTNGVYGTFNWPNNNDPTNGVWENIPAMFIASGLTNQAPPPTTNSNTGTSITIRNASLIWR